MACCVKEYNFNHQLLVFKKKEKTFDWNSQNEIVGKILNLECSSWEDFERECQIYLQKFKEEFQSEVQQQSEKLFKMEEELLKKPLTTVTLAQSMLAQNVTLHELEEIFAINVQKHPKYQNLIHLSHSHVCLSFLF